MSTLAEIEEAIEHLPAPQQAELAAWLEQRRGKVQAKVSQSEPDFLARAKSVWGEKPQGRPLSEIVSESRG